MEPKDLIEALRTILDGVENTAVQHDEANSDALSTLVAGMLFSELDGEKPTEEKIAETNIAVDLLVRILRKPRAANFAGMIIQKTHAKALAQLAPVFAGSPTDQVTK